MAGPRPVADLSVIFLVNIIMLTRGMLLQLQEVGAGLKNKIGTVINREDLWVTSKLWNTKYVGGSVGVVLTFKCLRACVSFMLFY